MVNRRFRVLAFLSLSAIVLDALTAVTISYATVVPLSLNIILNTANFMVFTYCSYYFTIYVHTFISEDFKPFLLNRILFFLDELAFVINIWGGYYFYFDEKKNYAHGSFYPIHLAIVYFFVAYTIFILVKNHKLMDYSRLFSAFSYVMALTIPYLIQSIISEPTLLLGFGISLALFIILFSLETPDYQRLTKTMTELDDAREEAIRANQAKSVFLSQMSHEIRTPINAIMGMNEMICKECNDEQILSYANAASDSANALLAIVNDILDFSKIEAGKMEITESKYEVASLLMDSYSMTIARAKDRGLALEFLCDTTIPSVLKGDMIRIRQILLNILTNAIKYTDKGKVTLEMNGEKIDDSFQLMIRVTDTGIGMTPESLEKLFGKFQRFDMKRNQTVEGTGLGMAITKQLTDLMHGSIEVESTYGEGSCFTVRLPQTIVDETPIGDYRIRYKQIGKDSVKDNLTFTAQNANILVVDDVKMNLIVFKNLLKDTGVKIDTCLSGPECLKLLQKNQYDMVFMDHMMPNMDGIETFQEMQKLPENLNKQTPVIMLTANAISGMEEQYLSQGFHGYLTKPIDSHKLRQLLLKYLPAHKIKFK